MERYYQMAGRFSRFITRPRALLHGSILEYLGVAFLFLVVTCAYTDFVAFDISNRIFTNSPGDGSGGFMWYTFAQPGLDLFLHHSDMVNYPDGENIGGPTFVTYFGLWIPIRILSFLFGPVAGINLFMMLGFVLTAVSMYWLVKKLTHSVPVALFAGYSAAFAPYMAQKSLNHIAYILLYVFVFMIAAFIGFWKRPTIKRAILLAGTIALAFYTDGYYILLGSVTIFCMVLAGFVYGFVVKMNKKQFFDRLKMLFVALGAFILMMSPVAILQLTKGPEVKASLDGRRSDIATELKAYKTHIVDLKLPAISNPFLKDNREFKKAWFEKSKRSNPSESTNYSGYTIYILVAVGVLILMVELARMLTKRTKVIKGLPEAQRQAFLLVGCIGVITIPAVLSFMFSPEGSIFGIRIPLPGELFIKYDISLWRVMSRFFVVLHVVLVLFAALTLGLLLYRVGRKKKTRYWAWVIAAILAGIISVEYASTANRPTLAFSNVNKAYYWLRNQPNIKEVVEVPVVDPLNSWTARHVTNQIVHGKKLLNRKEDTSTRISSVYGTKDNRELINWAYDRGADAVIAHDEQCDKVEWGKLLYDGDDSSEKVCIYSLDKRYDNDDLYVKFDDGFYNHIDKYKELPRTRVTMEKLKSEFFIVDGSFNKLTKNKPAKMEAVMQNTSDGAGKWTIEQGDEKIAEGEYDAHSEFNISAPVNTVGKLTLTIADASGRAVPGGVVFVKSLTVE